MKRLTFGLATCILLACRLEGQTLKGSAAGYHFPPSTNGPSPDGTWSLTATTRGDHRFSLLLHNGSERTFQLLDFDRECNALWSPDSSHIAVTDWTSSSDSDVLVFSVEHPNSPLSLAKLFPTNAIPPTERHGHCYFEANQWLDVRRLRLTVFGHRDEKPATTFEHSFIFNLMSRRFEKVGKQKPTALQSRPSPPGQLRIVR